MHSKRTRTPQISELILIHRVKSTHSLGFIRPHYFQRGYRDDYLELLRRGLKANILPDKDSSY